MSEWNKRIEDKLDSTLKEIAEIKMDQAIHHQESRGYMKRTEVLEQLLPPIKKHVDMVEGAAKLLALLGIVAGIIETVILWMRKS